MPLRRTNRSPNGRLMTEHVQDTSPASWQAPPWLDGVQKRALWVGVFGIAASVLGAFLSPQAFYRAYLVGFLFWIGIPIPCGCV